MLRFILIAVFVMFSGAVFAGDRASNAAANAGYGTGGTQNGNYSEPGKSYKAVNENGTPNPYQTPGSRPTVGGNPPYNSGPKTGPSDEEGEEY
jgi:hypothetical protein